MFSWMKKLHRTLVHSSSNQQSESDQDIPDKKGEPLSKDIKVNFEKMQDIFANSSDAVIRRFEVGSDVKIGAFIVYIDGLVDREIVQLSLMKPLMVDINPTTVGCKFNKKNALTIIKERILSISEVNEINCLQDAVNAVLSGDTVLFLDGSSTALIAGSRGWEARSIEAPDTEVVVRGSREGFTETLRTNTALLRRRIKSPNLKFESMKIGRQTQTDVIIAYIKGIANDKIVEEVKRRLSRIDTDSILESGYIEEYIEDNPLSFLPTVGNSEKPDMVAAKMLEGRVAILTDGTPFVLTVPYLFVEAFQSSEDYYSRPYYASFLRTLRYIAFFISEFAPAAYIALTTFHQEMLPPALLINMAASKEGTPFPAFIEAVIMNIIYEILKEAGVRLPRPVGQAVSIVGALVVGEAAVSAGLVGAPMVIVISITAVSAFVVSSINDTTTIMRFFYMILAGSLGIFGIMIGAVGFLTRLASMRSFGVPYLSPIAPLSTQDMKDVFIRAPWWAMHTRPRVIGWKNLVRQKYNLIPKPNKDDDKK